MDDPLESAVEPYTRSTPTWLRIGVWVAIVFLTTAVISGMFLY